MRSVDHKMKAQPDNSLNPEGSSDVISALDTDVYRGSSTPLEAEDAFLQGLFQRIESNRSIEPRAPRSIKLCGRLKARRKIGAGGLGSVYCYWDPELNRNIALKVAKSNVMKSAGRLQRFLREQEITAKLQHPAIPPVYQSGITPDGRPFYVMRLIEGETLLAKVKGPDLSTNSTPQTWSDRIYLLDAFLNICDAVQHAHDHGIIHRDIKPANIVVENSGVAFLVDWGLAKQEKQSGPVSDDPATISAEALKTGSDELTQDGQQLGTPDWMSPEQAAGHSEQHSKATDVYGLGATLFHILTGKAPHLSLRTTGFSLPEQMDLIANGPTPLARRLVWHIPPELSSICERAMNRDPLQRYESPADLKADIRRWQQKEPVVAHRDRYSILNRAGLFASRHQRALAIGLLALIALTVGAGWSTFRISQSAKAAETALTSQREANEQLFASLEQFEKFEQTVRTDKALASPQLKGLRTSIMAHLSQQYEIWSARSTGNQQDLARATKATLRLVEIEQESGDLLHALRLAERAKGLGQQAFEQSDKKSSDDVTPLLDACIAHCRIANAVDHPEVMKSLQNVDAVLAQSGRLLPVEQLLDYQATLEHLSASAYYSEAGDTPDLPTRAALLKSALAHTETCIERRGALRKLSDSRGHRLNYVTALNAQALMLHKLGNLKQAASVYEAGLQELNEVPQSKDNPDIDVSRLQVTILLNATMTYRARKELDKARTAAFQGIETCRMLSEKFPLMIRYREDLGRGYGNLAEVIIDQLRMAPKASLLSDLLVKLRTSAETYHAIDREYPELESMTAAAAAQYLWHSTSLYWADGTDQKASLLSDLLVTLRTAAETYHAIYREYPERESMRVSAAIHYLRLSASLHWADRDAEALAEFQRSLSLANNPVDLEKGHQPNAYAAATGYALLIRADQDQAPAKNPLADRLKTALEIATPMLLNDKVSQEMFIKDPLFQGLSDLPGVASLYDQLKTEK